MTAPISAPAPDPRAPAGRQRFRHAARMEWIKLRSLRYPAWTLLLAVAGTAAAGAAAGFNTKNPSGDPTNNILAGIALGQVAIGVLGVLTMTSEYSSGMIRATLAAVPSRPLLLAAKATVLGAAALAAGQIACFAASWPAWPSCGQPCRIRRSASPRYCAQSR